jgi:spore coat protein A
MLGGLVVPAGLVGFRPGRPGAAESPHAAHPAMDDSFPPSPPVVPFQAAFRTPPVLEPVRSDESTDYYEIDIEPASKEILPGLHTLIWGFNGEFPGPTIRARSGRRVVVRHWNRLDEAQPAIHLHGGHVEPSSDGYPTDVIAPGAYRDYLYPNGQIASTLSYHDHQMDRTGPNVYMGLFGAYLIDDDVDAALNLPSGDQDVPVIIQDRLFNSDGSLNYLHDLVEGARGDVILVNGVPQPRFTVANRKYRLRFLNGSNSRPYELALSSGQPLIQIASDGGLLPQPVERQTIPLFPFERVEVVVDFSTVPPGSAIVLENRLEVGRTGQVMLFQVDREEPDESTVPAELRPVERLSEAAATVTREFEFGLDGTDWVINGQGFDHHRIDADPQIGATEIWQFSNTSPMPHPIHVHLEFFQILDRNGTPPGPAEAGWKDTVAVAPQETVRVIVRFNDFLGRYMFHCHNLEHEDDGMMANFEVVPGPVGPVS